MNRAQAAANLGIAGFFIFNIVRHMIRPGGNIMYTRMLMFVCLATIPMAFMLGPLGGRDRWPFLLDKAREIAPISEYSWLAIAGLAVLMVVLPLVIFIGIGFMMDLRSGLFFAMYFFPLVMRFVLEPAKACIETAVINVVNFFVSVFVAIGIVYIVNKYGPGVAMYERHLHKIWPGYGTAATMFFWVCSFALLNQLVEFGRALLVLERGS
jgi:hypothetical protein